MSTKKIIKKRVISFTELTYDDGTLELTPKTTDFNDFELIGLLKYYLDLYVVRTIQINNKKP